ncbi:hypothetical protein Tco_0544940, partial [Tanacetum coccineum]
IPQIATASTTVNGEVELTASIDGQAKTITKASLRRHLKLEDNGGISSLPNTEIFEQLALMGYATDSDKLIFQKEVNTGRTKLNTARPKLSTDSTKIESMKLEAIVEERRIFKCWFHYHTTNGHQFTMSNRHQELASPDKELASPKQTALGKDILNPLIVDSLLKTIWLSTHHVIVMKHWLFQSKRLLVKKYQIRLWLVVFQKLYGQLSWYCCVAELLRYYDDDKD